MNKKKKVSRQQKTGPVSGGRLRIGDNWNAITIIALSQSNPLKAIAEFVENSIDAGARNITIIRGKERRLNEIISEQRKAEEERASRKILKSVQNALKEAILALPKDEYDWFDIHVDSMSRTGSSSNFLNLQSLFSASGYLRHRPLFL